MKAVFEASAVTEYNDDITTRYHFPNRLLPAAREAEGDWIVYREPRRGGRNAYIAVAHLQRLALDPLSPNHTYAYVSDFLPFDAPVPLKGPRGFYEEILRKVDDPTRRGVTIHGKSVRLLSEADFGAIVRAGLGQTLAPENAVRLELDAGHLDQADRKLVEASPEEQERRVVQLLVNKKVRDAAFRRSVIDAYGGRCAVTGIRLVNGGGKAEAQAAHIRAVAAGGPDIVQNGVALSATAHWLFDRFLISFTDDLGLLVAHNRVPAEMQVLFAKQMERIHHPNDDRRPHPRFVQWHRERFAAG